MSVRLEFAANGWGRCLVDVGPTGETKSRNQGAGTRKLKCLELSNLIRVVNVLAAVRLSLASFTTDTDVL